MKKTFSAIALFLAVSAIQAETVRYDLNANYTLGYLDLEILIDDTCTGHIIWHTTSSGDPMWVQEAIQGCNITVNYPAGTKEIAFHRPNGQGFTGWLTIDQGLIAGKFRAASSDFPWFATVTIE